MGQNPDITIPRYNNITLLLPWHIVISGFHCTYNTTYNAIYNTYETIQI